MDSSANIQAIYELAPQQEGMLYESISHAGEMFIEQEIHSLPGSIDPRLFDLSWSHLLMRHAMLRTAFVWKTRKRPLQVVFERATPSTTLLDWRKRPAFEQNRLLEEFLTQDRRRGFDLAVAPLLRLALIRVSEDVYRFVWTQHHLLFDGWSRALLWEEFGSIYGALARGAPLEARPAPEYARYVEWLARWDVDAAEQFWRRILAGFSSPNALGRATPATTPAAEEFGQTDLEFTREETARLERTVRAHRLTPATLLHGAWAILLSRYGGSDDVVFGTTVSGRPADCPGADSMIGLFINTVPLRITVDPNADVWSWLEGVQARLLELRQFEFCSAGQIHQWSELPGAMPLYQSIVVFENYPMRKELGAGAPASQGRYIGARSAHPLALLASAQHAGFIIRAVYNTGTVRRPAAARILDHVRALFRHLTGDRELRVRDLQSLVGEYDIPYVQAGDRAAARPQVAVPPATPLERRMVELAQEVLGVDDIGMTDRFFALGGHSLLAIQFILRLKQAFEIDVPMRVLFEAADMRQLATWIERIILEKIESLSEEEAEQLVGRFGVTTGDA